MEGNNISIADTTANPAPLGLMAFGMTTVLLNLANAGIIHLSSMILAMGIFYGGIGQVIAGAMEWKKKNTFGTLAFSSYGLFWLTLVWLIVMPSMHTGIGGAKAGGMAAYLIMWGIFTGLMFIGTLKLSRALQWVFATLTILFFLLAAHELTGNASIGTFAGYEGILCGALAMYASITQVWSELFAPKPVATAGEAASA